MGVKMKNIILILYLTILAEGSLYDPHVFPQKGPFMEGWYLRFVDFNTGHSFAALLGSVLPEDANKSGKLAFVGLLEGHEGEPLHLHAKYVSTQEFNITVGNGQPVTSNPDMESPANFQIVVPSVGNLVVKPDSAELEFLVGSIHFQARIGVPVPWDPYGEGPAGWVQHLSFMLPLNWFVYSIRSPLLYYKWSNLQTGNSSTGTEGLVHMEKNWGDSFPKAWVWSQAISQTNHDITYALTYGPVTMFKFVKVTGFLFGYRNPQKNLTINFNPTNSFISASSTSACTGGITMAIEGMEYTINLSVFATLSTFSECLPGPFKNGFRPGCVESFEAHAEIVVYRRQYLIYSELVDRQEFTAQAALEFGGGFMCEPCHQS